VEERRSHAPEQGGGARFKLNAGAGLRGRSRRKIQGPSLGAPQPEVRRRRSAASALIYIATGGMDWGRGRKEGGGRRERRSHLQAVAATGIDKSSSQIAAAGRQHLRRSIVCSLRRRCLTVCNDDPARRQATGGTLAVGCCAAA